MALRQPIDKSRDRGLSAGAVTPSVLAAGAGSSDLGTSGLWDRLESTLLIAALVVIGALALWSLRMRRELRRRERADVDADGDSPGNAAQSGAGEASEREDAAGHELGTMLLRHTRSAVVNQRVVLDSAGEPSDLVLVDVNGVFERWVGRPRSELLGKSAADVIPGGRERCGALLEMMLEVARTGERRQGTVRLTKADRWLEVSASRPAPERVLALAEDVTARGRAAVASLAEKSARAECALRQSEQRLELALAGADLARWDWDLRSGRVVYNDRWSELLGVEPAEVEPTVAGWRRLVHPDDLPKVAAEIERHLVGEATSFEAEYRVRTASCRWRWVLDRGRVVEREANGRPRRASGTRLDITRRREAEAEQERLEVELRQAQKFEAIGTLASGVAHDLGNLLTAAGGYVELTRRRIDDPELDHFLAEALRANQRAAAVARALLVFAWKGESRWEPVDLSELVAEVAGLLGSLLPSSIEIVDATPTGLSSWVRADRDQLLQVLLNLAVNARDAMPGGGRLAFSVRAPVDGESASGCREAVLVVEDTGCGMSEETRSRAFEPFFTTKERGRGTGLGLALVYGIVESHGGRIDVASGLGSGSRFELRLPEAGRRPRGTDLLS